MNSAAAVSAAPDLGGFRADTAAVEVTSWNTA
jgi:hypothetical protein